MNIETKTLLLVATLAMQGLAISVSAGTIPTQLPKPDANPGDATKPRGGHVWADLRDEFKSGKVTIAVSNFPMNNERADGFIPARAPLGVWLEEMKIPPVGE